MGIKTLGIRFWSGGAIALLAVSSAMGQTPLPSPQPAQHQALKPGRSAGVKNAQEGIHPSVALVGASAIIALVVVTTANSSGNNSLPNDQSVPATTP